MVIIRFTVRRGIPRQEASVQMARVCQGLGEAGLAGQGIVGVLYEPSLMATTCQLPAPRKAHRNGLLVCANFISLCPLLSPPSRLRIVSWFSHVCLYNFLQKDECWVSQLLLRSK